MSITPLELWDGVLRRLEADMTPFAFDAWVRPLEARIDGSRVRLLCPTAFHLERVRGHFLALIARHLEAERGEPVQLDLVVSAPAPGARPTGTRASRTAPPPPREDAAPENETAAPPVAAGSPPLVMQRVAPAHQPELPCFANFVVGPCNALAREASLAVAQGRQERLHVLYLTAEAGLGKTHLARAIASEAQARNATRVVYASAEAFTNEFTSSLRSKRMDQFKRRYRHGCGLLVVEDVQFLRAKKATQLELFHTISHLLDTGARVVLTGDRLPRDIEQLDLRLRSQMSAGLVAELEPPDATVRRKILRAKAAGGGVRLPDDCRELIVAAVRGSVRDLEGVLIQLVASASLLKRPIDTDLTRAALHKLQPEPSVRCIDPHDVLEIVAAFFRTRPERLASRSRRRDVLWPRQLAMYLCRRYTDTSHAEIARLLGREHTAVRNAILVVERGMLEHAPRRYQIEALCERIDSLEKERRR